MQYIYEGNYEIPDAQGQLGRDQEALEIQIDLSDNDPEAIGLLIQYTES